MVRIRIISDTRSLFRFLASLWGVVTLLIFLFSLINGAVHIIPIANSHSGLATVLAFLISLFAMIYSFSERILPIGFMAFRNALGRLGTALASLAVYLILDAFYGQFATQTGEFANVVSAVISAMSIITYATFFGLLTAAFGAMAVIEYTNQPEEAAELDKEALG